MPGQWQAWTSIDEQAWSPLDQEYLYRDSTRTPTVEFIEWESPYPLSLRFLKVWFVKASDNQYITSVELEVWTSDWTSASPSSSWVFLKSCSKQLSDHSCIKISSTKK